MINEDKFELTVLTVALEQIDLRVLRQAESM